MPVTINYKKRAVAFIDVLGFKEIVKRSIKSTAHLQVLQDLVNILDSSIPNFNNTVSATIPNNLIPEHTYISDCIILSAPLSDPNISYYSGLSTVIMRCIQLSHLLLENGYLVSGGISVGDLWHIPSNIVGIPYQEAYLLESNNKNPSIVLSESAKNHWLSLSNRPDPLCMNYKKHTIVNMYHEYYIPNNTVHGVIDDQYKKYMATINKNIVSSLPCKAKKKWRWQKEFIKSTYKDYA